MASVLPLPAFCTIILFLKRFLMHHIPFSASSSQEFLPVSLYDEKAEFISEELFMEIRNFQIIDIRMETVQKVA